MTPGMPSTLRGAFTFTLLFSIALLLCILLGIQSRRRKGQMLFALVSVYVFCTPLFIVTP